MKKITKTPGQRYFEEGYPQARWDKLNSSDRETFEVKANRLGIQPIEEDVPDPPKTDEELWEQAYQEAKRVHALAAPGWQYVLPIYVKRLRERDGEPPKVTAELLRKAHTPGASWQEYADSINAALAKAKDGAK